jgi:hypothetical protein
LPTVDPTGYEVARMKAAGESPSDGPGGDRCDRDQRSRCTASVWLGSFGAGLILSRLLHAWGLLAGTGLFGRVAGTLLMRHLLGAQALACIIRAWR